MEVIAKLRFAKITPRKARLVAGVIRGEKVESARQALSFLPKKGARILEKILVSAVANAEDRGIGDPDELYVSRVFVDEGPVQKRFRARAMGRSSIIRKRMSHITIAVSSKK